MYERDQGIPHMRRLHNRWQGHCHYMHTALNISLIRWAVKEQPPDRVS